MGACRNHYAAIDFSDSEGILICTCDHQRPQVPALSLEDSAHIKPWYRYPVTKKLAGPRLPRGA